MYKLSHSRLWGQSRIIDRCHGAHANLQSGLRSRMHPFRRIMFRFPPRVRRRVRFAAGCCLLLAGAGCVHRSSNRHAASLANVPSEAAIRLLGNIHVIGTGGHFVLVEASVAAAAAGLADGQTLVCRAAGADTATLRVSHERRPPFVVADVDSGTPQIGDEVFVVPATAPPAKPTAPSPAPSAPPFRADPSLPPAL